MYIGDMDR